MAGKFQSKHDARVWFHTRGTVLNGVVFGDLNACTPWLDKARETWEAKQRARQGTGPSSIRTTEHARSMARDAAIWAKPGAKPVAKDTPKPRYGRTRRGKRSWTDDQVREFRRRVAAGTVTQVDLAVELGVTANAVWNMINRRTYKHVADEDDEEG